jgi:uncharacterized protein
MLRQPRRKSLHYVVKISKFCNLRCTYCYEYAELGLKHRMSLDQIATMFKHAADYAEANKLEELNFIWHGGEPFLVPLEIYEAIGELQRDIFGESIPFQNSVQTNLTVLTDKHLDFLRSKRFFSGVGVSFDVYGDQRIDIKGRQRTQTVLANIERLRDAQVPFGVITVLARNTLPHSRAIYRFFDTLGIRFRFLPFYLSASDPQIGAHALTFDEIVNALNGVFDDWLTSPTATTVHPVQEHIETAVAVMSGAQRTRYDKFADEIVFLINTDGSVHGVADAYNADYSYGNAFHESMETVVNSPGRMRAAEEADARYEQHCAKCPYNGACPGDFVVNATPEQKKLLAESGCPLRSAITHVIKRVDKSGLAPLFKERANATQPGNAALATPL